MAHCRRSAEMMRMTRSERSLNPSGLIPSHQPSGVSTSRLALTEHRPRAHSMCAGARSSIAARQAACAALTRHSASSRLRARSASSARCSGVRTCGALKVCVTVTHTASASQPTVCAASARTAASSRIEVASIESRHERVSSGHWNTTARMESRSRTTSKPSKGNTPSRPIAAFPAPASMAIRPFSVTRR